MLNQFKEKLGERLNGKEEVVSDVTVKSYYASVPLNRMDVCAYNDILIYQIIRDSINLMVKDLIKNTMKNLRIKKAKSVHDIYSCKDRLVCFSNKFMKIEKEIKYFLKTRMYDNKNVLIKNNKGKKIIRKLFDEIYSNLRKYLNKEHYIKKISV